MHNFNILCADESEAEEITILTIDFSSKNPPIHYIQ